MQQTVRITSLLACFMYPHACNAKGDKDVNDLIKAMKDVDGQINISTQVRKIYKNATRTMITKMTNHDNDGISIHSAWELISRSLRNPTPSRSGEYPNLVKIDRKKLAGFIGFVRGRLKITLPEPWEKVCGKLKYSSKSRLSTSARLNNGKDIYHITEVGMSAPQGLQCKRANKTVIISTGKDKMKIPRRIIKQEGGIFAIHNQSVTAKFTKKKLFVAFHPDQCSYYRMYCLRRKHKKILWNSTIFSNPHCTNGAGGHYVHIVVDRDRVLVFGITYNGIYIEAFSENDGKPLWRFSTGYYPEWPQHDK